MNVTRVSKSLSGPALNHLELLESKYGYLRIMSLFYFQGLFHPARKVRDVYWKIYNTLYIGAQDSLVAGYPRVPNDEKNQYVRYELEYFL